MHIFSDLTMYKRMRIAFLPGGSDIHIWKRLLVPRDFGKKQHPQMLPFGADDGNRTHTTSLEGWDSSHWTTPAYSATLMIIAQKVPFVNLFSSIFSHIFRAGHPFYSRRREVFKFCFRVWNRHTNFLPLSKEKSRRKLTIRWQCAPFCATIILFAETNSRTISAAECRKRKDRFKWRK